MKSKKLMKALSIILALIITLQLIPPEVYTVTAESILLSAEEEELKNEETEELTTQTEEEKELTVIGEDKSRREANVKHYIMNDGSMMAVSYSQAVHYEENGEWLTEEAHQSSFPLQNRQAYSELSEFQKIF